IADDTAVVPPVVPDVAAGFQFESETGNARFGRAIVELNGDGVFSRLKEFGDIKEIAGVAALVGADGSAVDPDVRKIEGRCEMEFDVYLRRERREVEGAEIPRNAFVVVVFADVPGVRHADRFRAGGDGLEPGLRFAFGCGISAKEPVTVEIHLLGGCGESGEKQQRAEQERGKGSRGPAHEISGRKRNRSKNVNAIIAGYFSRRNVCWCPGSCQSCFSAVRRISRAGCGVASQGRLVTKRSVPARSWKAKPDCWLPPLNSPHSTGM